MKKGVLLVGLLVMFMIVGGAIVWDCVRLAQDAQHRVSLADDEVTKHELRLMKLLEASPALTPELEAAIAQYGAANSLVAKRAAYETVVAGFRKSMQSRVDATNPLDRKFMDDVAGAINRRELALKPYEQELAAYNAFMVSVRGSIAGWFVTDDVASARASD
jgi:hypothetical protein